MNHPNRSRHGPVCRGLALWLIVAQFILFSVGELAHRHARPAGATSVASVPGSAYATSTDRAHLQTPASSDHDDSTPCPICQSAHSAAAALVTGYSSSFVLTLCGRAPIASPIFIPGLALSLSSARAPPTL
jgi:Protein of unknown function (DUF2946)